jgi:hypothetical protein
MTGSHEVRGSIPLSSTKKTKGALLEKSGPFFIGNNYPTESSPSSGSG